ncbi:hypothetical protein FNV62_07485 [Streptomyces sp. RLB3-17]|uniref:hypothetical protein n=1 Tax=unclassified Streptomyces TaxID=2593676 RepID=UPI001163BF65|nr:MULTISPECIES: hypothetical protein [unclassified Streptomyces]NMI56009.1 hypothetical protein [Streptomyces sp. RLA2-12]QDN55466.1 hypothetical protein FNV67_09245 [Streptomyces sp. S1D4-20]QDN65644.1 hypothetical protein FNV66_08840 [Streptomyces sp. S1D4-14]QDO17997.1 hypothetical protein FNV65_08440 [Streptomyces sp. S1A1-8]QDO28124.1 hypothetical protein FNV63_08455 [Streptomyces sp. S1A1-3]
MAVATDMLVPALREVREAEAALADRFKTHVAVTPAGEYREVLERRVGDARGHVYRVNERLDTLHPRGLAQTVLGNVWRLTGQAARLPFDVAMAVPSAVLRGWGTTSEQQLLKNAEDEYAVTAFAVAICRASERIAQEAEDAVSLDLLSSIRRDGEEALEELGSSLEQHAEAAVVAAETAETAEDLGTTGAAQAVRAWSNWLRETAERMPGADRLQSAPEGSLISEDELPIPDYRRLSTKMIIDRLPRLSQTDLATLGAYERTHAGRPVVLSRITDLLGPVPWPGYDTMHADEILKRLADAESGLTRRVLDYERRHHARSTILAAAERAHA